MSVRRRLGLAALVVGAAVASLAAHAAEVRLLGAAAVKGPVTELAATFERETGHRVVLEFATAGAVDAKLAAGARPAIVVNGSGRIAARAGTAAANAGVVRDLGTVRIGVAVRAGAPRPELSSAAAFRAALLAASSVAYGDPAGGATTGIHFAKVADQLGITGALAAKRQLATDGLDVMARVKRGEAELGITQKSEILLVDPSTFAGLLPDELQLATTYTAWVPDGGDAAAVAFVDALVGARGRDVFRSAGFDPPAASGR